MLTRRVWIWVLALPRRARAALVAGSVMLVAGIGLMYLDAQFPLALPDSHHHYAQVVTDREGHPLRAFPDRKGVWRYQVSLEAVSPHYLEALLTYEDRRFWWHFGVDPLAMVRAVGQMAVHGRPVSGGSTITMQVARLLHPHRKTLSGKLYQMLRALQLEWHLSKREILTLYCNIAPFGGMIEGVQAASFTYLNKPAKHLTRAEAALLAVLPQSPTRFRPDLHPQAALHARDKVLDRLVAFDVWNAQTVMDAKLEGVAAAHHRIEPHAGLLARRLAQQTSQAVIRTPIDRAWQLSVERILQSALATAPERTSAAALVVDNRTGEVKAYVGAADFGNLERFGHVDMVTATRSPGSTLKPFLYGLALESGLIHEQSLLADAPLSWEGYRPQNFSGGFVGPVSAAEALQRSLNVPAVTLLDQYGPEAFAARLQNAGLTLAIAGGKPNLSLILGGAGTQLEALVATYTAFANGGVTRPLQYHLTNDAPPVTPPATGRYVMSEGAAWVVQEVLRGVPRPGALRAVSSLAKGPRLAWKTGTSFGGRDAWAVGLDAQVTIGVWVGRPDGSFSSNNTGRAAAGPLLHEIADSLGVGVAQVSRPQSVARAAICWPLGGHAALQPERFCHQRREAWLIDTLAPNTLVGPKAEVTQNPLRFWSVAGERVNGHCTRQGAEPHLVALWPSALEPWLPRAWRRRTQVPNLVEGCQPRGVTWSPLTIEGITSGAILTAPSNQATAPHLPLQAAGGEGQYHWYVNGQLLGRATDTPPVLALSDPGVYQIVVVDEAGNLDKREVRVR